jgi:hypothetical protein
MTSKENRVAPALSFIFDDEKGLGDMGNLLTLRMADEIFCHSTKQKYGTDTHSKAKLDWPGLHVLSTSQQNERCL